MLTSAVEKQLLCLKKLAKNTTIFSLIVSMHTLTQKVMIIRPFVYSEKIKVFFRKHFLDQNQIKRQIKSKEATAK